MRLHQNQKRKGQGLVEYGLLIAGVALICTAAVSIFGHKTSHLYAATAVVLPGAHTDDNGPIFAGQLIETTSAGTSTSTPGAGLGLDLTKIGTNSGKDRLQLGVTGQGATPGFDGLINEAD